MFPTAPMLAVSLLDSVIAHAHAIVEMSRIDQRVNDACQRIFHRPSAELGGIVMLGASVEFNESLHSNQLVLRTEMRAAGRPVFAAYFAAKFTSDGLGVRVLRILGADGSLTTDSLQPYCAVLAETLKEHITL